MFVEGVLVRLGTCLVKLGGLINIMKIGKTWGCHKNPIGKESDCLQLKN